MHLDKTHNFNFLSASKSLRSSTTNNLTNVEAFPDLFETSHIYLPHISAWIEERIKLQFKLSCFMRMPSLGSNSIPSLYQISVLIFMSDKVHSKTTSEPMRTFI